MDRPSEDRTAAAAVASDLRSRIEAARRRLRFVMLWEELWPRLIWPLGIALLFIGCAWLGLFVGLSATVRTGLLVLFGLGFLASLLAFRGWRRPSALDLTGRLEHTSGLTGHPISTLEDRLPEGADAVAQALWNTHRARVAATIGQLRSGVPHPDLGRRDVYALRPALALLLFVGFLTAGDERLARLEGAFSGRRPAPPVEARLDAWVTPPGYTGRAPVMLTGERQAATESDGTYHVPQGSIVAVRANAGSTPLGPVAAALVGPARQAIDAKAGANDIAKEFETRLDTDSQVEIALGGNKPTAWRFTVAPDTPPTIRLVGKPEAQLSGALKLVYEVGDDYGVVAARAALATAGDALSSGPAGRPLVPAPDFGLSLPQGRGKVGQGQTIRDLSAHPWAGARVRMTLEAQDEAGQTGRSEPIIVTLPQKRFVKPLARAVVEQRRILALDADRLGSVRDGIDALMIAPEVLIDDASIYFGMRMIRTALADARNDDQLREALDLMWTVARQIEDGDLTEAEKALRDAQEKLRQAIENGASEQEIARLMQELRNAMDKYLAEMMQRGMRNPQAARPPSSNTRQLRKQDLDRMLKRIEDLARTGSRDAARQLLSELQQMLENMQPGRAQRQQGDGQSPMSDMMDKLGEMMRRQQELMDQTHRLDPRNGQQRGQNNRRQPGQQGQQPGGGQPMSPDELAEALRQLQQGQGDLQRQLQEMLGQMEQQGLGDRGEGMGQALGEAGKEMGEAGESLGQGKPGDALGPEGRALDQLRRGAQQLADEMMRRQGNQPGRGQLSGDQGNDDPLGRPRRNEGPDLSDTVRVPDEIDAERARKILEAIRERLSDPLRSQLELDYLDRLLKSE